METISFSWSKFPEYEKNRENAFGDKYFLFETSHLF